MITIATPFLPHNAFSCHTSHHPVTYLGPAIMARNAQSNLRVRPSLKAKLEKLAKQDRRALSAHVEKLLEDDVKRTSRLGFLSGRRPAFVPAAVC